MASNPYLICEGNAASGTNPLVLTVATPTSAGDVIFVAANTASVGQTITGVTDSKGNTYSAINSDLTEVDTYQFETTGTTVALTTSDTVTVTYSNTPGAKAGIVVGLPGYQSGHDVAPATVNGASATSSSISSGTLGQANEVVMAVLSTGSQVTGPAWGSGWTQAGVARQASNPWLTVAYKIVSSTASVAATASWTASVKYCTLLSSFKVPGTPPPTGMYLIGQAQHASGGTAQLSVPVSTNTSPGDTITVGAVASAGSVTGVTDTAGNSYSLVQSETANAGAQLYTFEAYNTDALSTSGSPNPHAAKFGNICDYRNYTFDYTATHATPAVFTITSSGITQHGLPNGTQVQLSSGTAPGGFTNGTTYYVVGTTGNTFKLAATLGGAAIASTTTGSGAQQFNIVGITTTYTASQQADTDAGLAMALGATGCQKFYYNPGTFRANFTLQSGQDATAIVAAGTRIWLCVKPDPSGSDLSALQSMLTWWIANSPGGTSQLKVVLWQEAQNASNGLTSTSFINCVKNYASMIHGLGLKIVYDAAGHAQSEWTSWYPGNQYIDEIAVDFYGNTWSQYTHAGTTNLDPLAVLHQLADNNNKPFGFGEIGQAIYGVGAGLSDTLFKPYINYITTLMQGRLQAGKTNSDVMWYNGLDGANGNTILPGDWRVPYLTTLWNAITSSSSSGSITVTYSGTASNQAAIAVGDSNVQSGDDKTVGATATSGTTASVATGTLSQAGEHIIAFVADLAAGGSPTMGGGLTALGGIQAGTGPFIKAGIESVTSTSTTTPSATIASTTWSISVVTHQLNVPVILGSGPGTAIIGQAFSYTASETGGTGTITWSSSGTLPPGLTFSSSGILNGTPTTAGTYAYTLIATDSLGLQGTFGVTQLVIPATAPTGGPAPATPLPGNVLNLADSDAETSSGYTWTALTNASTPAPSTSASVAGTSSTAWTALAAGDTQITTGMYPVVGGMPYIASCFLLTGQNLLADVTINWFDITQTLIATESAPNLIGAVPNGWTPLNFATVAPSSAVSAALVVNVPGASPGQAFNMDLAFLSQSSAQILIDWNNPVFASGGAAGQMFMDVSPFVRFDQNVTYTRGRQDAISQVQPGSASFELQNDLGTFTRFSTISIPASVGGAVSLQCRSQINLADESGNWWTRFDGAIAQIDYSFDNTGNTSVATITLTDVLSGLNRQDTLFCWTKEQVLTDSPQYHWSLDDPGNVGGTGVGAETSGSNGPPMRLSSSDSTGTGTINWQDTGGGVETLANAVRAGAPDGSEYWTPGLNQANQASRGLDSGVVGPFTTPIPSIYLTPKLTAQSAQNLFIGNTGYMLSTELATPLVSLPGDINGYTIETWVTVDPQVQAHAGSNYGPYIALSLGSSRTYTCLVIGLFLSSGNVDWQVQSLTQPPSFRGQNFSGSAVASGYTLTNTTPAPGDVARVPHHLVVDVIYDAIAGFQVASFYLDGVFVGNGTLPAGQTYDTICVGGAFGGTGSWYGNISLVSVYPYSLSQFQIAQHCQLGQYGMWETPSDNAIAQIASYANIPAFWSNVSAQNNGLTLTEYMDITGSNALTNMQLFAQAENGLLFPTAEGALTFHTRDWRMGYGAPDLLLAPGSFEADMNYEVVDQFMTNEMGVAGPATTGASALQGALLSAATGVIQQTPNSVASANTQAGYINAASQDKYGVYAQNPVSTPVSLPLITFSRAYAQLGIPSLSYWPDPNLIDTAAWNANSRSEPWMFPAQLTADLLTLGDPNITVTITQEDGTQVTVPLDISTFYALEIDNMVAATGVLPASLPNVAGSLEWFIEGISETVSQNSRTLQLYVSPAETQRAWIPGDPVYGVLGSTTRLGISQADLSVPEADGKDVSHDAGAPYWPPSFSSAMNNPDGSGNAFIGSQDMRGIAANLQDLLTPVMLNVAANADSQTIVNGALSDPTIYWDFIHVDTEGGMGAVPGYPNWYVVTKPGWYEIDAGVTWSLATSQAGYTAQAWIAVAQGAAQALAAGTGTPRNISQYVCPVGDACRLTSASITPINAVSTRMYLGLGDMVAVAAEFNFTAARGTSSAGAGCMLSMVRTGVGTVDDRTEINSSLSSGGTVTIPVKGTLKQVTFANTHTYSYQGATGFAPFHRRNTDLDAFQGHALGTTNQGSQAAQIAFDAFAITSALTGHQIQSATLQAVNLGSWYTTGVELMLGTTTVTPGQATYTAGGANSDANIMHQLFRQGQQLTFVIPVSMVKGFVSGGQTAFILGDSFTTNLDHSGSWQGGPGAWILTINYV